ncbi:MAG: stage V sporulation protein AE [Clostridia bacterium]|nr:stage V sporulation protein AE [Clostridia bacterium]MDD4386165.1 stage V sporulation protein AE [Clostridia bacterium]
MFSEYLYVFITGGVICSIGQVLIDKTKLTPARILVIFVVLGVIFTATGIYKPIVDFGKAGATVPISGFGYSLANGVIEGVKEKGFMGIFTGGVTATSAGITAAIVFGYIGALVSKPKLK